MDLYFIYTENRFNQVLIFNSFEEALKWCKAATCWSDEQIMAKIQKPIKQGNFYSLFQY